MTERSQKLWTEVTRRPMLARVLCVASYLGVIVEAAVLAALLYVLLAEAPFIAVVGAGVLFVGFVAVTLWRQRRNAPRPYEVCDVFVKPPRQRAGLSYPSRHAFSAFAIASLAMFVHPLLGTIGLVMALVQGAARYALGIHFLRDVCVGGVVGCALGCIGGALARWLMLL